MNMTTLWQQYDIITGTRGSLSSLSSDVSLTSGYVSLPSSANVRVSANTQKHRSATTNTDTYRHRQFLFLWEQNPHNILPGIRGNRMLWEEKMCQTTSLSCKMIDPQRRRRRCKTINKTLVLQLIWSCDWRVIGHINIKGQGMSWKQSQLGCTAASAAFLV